MGVDTNNKLIEWGKTLNDYMDDEMIIGDEFEDGMIQINGGNGNVDFGDEQQFSSNIVLSSFQFLAYFLITTSNLILFH